MRYIEITNFDPGEGKEYMPQHYLSSGAYFNQRLNMVFFVYPTPNLTTMQLMVHGVTCAQQIRESAGVPGMPVGGPGSGISEDFVLRALAIAQNPALAQGLLGSSK